MVAFATSLNPCGIIEKVLWVSLKCPVSAFIRGERCSLQWPNSTQSAGKEGGRPWHEGLGTGLSVLVLPLLGLWPGVNHVAILSLYFFIHKLVWINLEPYVTNGKPAWQHWLIALLPLAHKVLFKIHDFFLVCLSPHPSLSSHTQSSSLVYVTFQDPMSLQSLNEMISDVPSNSDTQRV